MQSPVVLHFLGKRNYLQGATLLDTLLDASEQSHAVDFKFRNVITSNQIRLELGDAAVLEAKQPDASLTWLTEQGLRGVAAFALPPVQPIQAIPYPEEEVINAASFKNDTVVYDKPWPFTFSGTLFCLLKKLEIHYRKNEGGMWLFGGMHIDCIPKMNTPLAVKKDHLLPNGRLLRMSLLADGVLFGTAYTSWVANEKLNFSQ